MICRNFLGFGLDSFTSPANDGSTRPTNGNNTKLLAIVGDLSVVSHVK